MSSIELGELNLRQGKHAVAFDIFFELAQFELSADAQFALVKMCSEGFTKYRAGGKFDELAKP